MSAPAAPAPGVPSPALPAPAAGRSWAELARSILVAVVVAALVRALALEAFQIPTASMVPSLVVGDHILVSKLAYGLRLPLAAGWLWRWGEPRRGDVLVFTNARDGGRDYVKRVVGVPGDVVELRDQVLYVNGVPQPREPVGELAYDEWSESTGQWWTERCSGWRERLARGAVPPPRTASAAALASAFGEAASGGVAAHVVLQCRRERLGRREGPFERVAPGHLFVLGDNRDRSADSRSAGGWQVPIADVRGKAIMVWWSWGRSGWSPWRGQGGLRAERLFKPIE